MTNVGGAGATGCSRSLSGDNWVEFEISSTTCGATLASTATCTITVKATPLATGTRSSNLTMACNESSVSTTSPGITVTGLAKGTFPLGINNYFFHGNTVTVDNNGKIYVSDDDSMKVFVYKSDRTFDFSIGSQGSGNGQFDFIGGIAVDTTGKIYVTDRTNCRVQVFSSTGSYLSQFGSCGSGNTQFNNPMGISIDTVNNRIAVADQYNNQVKVFTLAGVYVASIGTGSGTSANGDVSGPAGVAFAKDGSGKLHVADTYNYRVQTFNSSYAYVSKFGTNGAGNGELGMTEGVAVDSSGKFYVTDRDNYRFQIFAANGTYLSQTGTQGNGNGQFEVTMDGMPAIAINDITGDIYVSDAGNYRVQVFNSSGVYSSTLASRGKSNGEFDSPTGIALDSSGKIYISDTNNNRIQVYNATGGYASTIGSVGSGNGQFGNITLGPIAIDQISGKLYVCDPWGNNRVQIFQSNGTYFSQFAITNSCYGLAVDGTNGRVYVAQGNQVKVYNLVGAYVTAIGTVGAGATDGLFSQVGGMTVDSSGKLYVADQYNSRVQVFSSAGAFLFKFSGSMGLPTSVAVSNATGKIYVSDEGGNDVKVYDSTGNYLSTLATVGSNTTQVRYPRHMAVDSSDNLLVVDTSNNRVLKFTNAGVPVN